MSGRIQPGTKLAAAAVAAVLFVVIALLFVWPGYEPLGKAISISLHRDRITPLKRLVYTGDPLDWRIVGQRSRTRITEPGLQGGVSVADFDGDADDEILFIPLEGPGNLIELDGFKQAISLESAQVSWPWGWDIDGDGSAEVLGLRDPAEFEASGIPERPGLSLETEFYRLDGQPLARLDGFALAGGDPTIDVNADGVDELLLCTGAGQFTVFGQRGELVETFISVTPRISSAFADVNDDGKLEQLDYDSRQRRVSAWDSAGEEVRSLDLDGYGEFITSFSRSGSLPDTLVFTNGLMLFPAAEFVELDLPENWQLDRRVTQLIVGGKFNAQQDAVIAASIAGKDGSGGIALFDSYGTLKYHEELSKSRVAILAARAQGRDYLVAHTPDRLLVYP